MELDASNPSAPTATLRVGVPPGKLETLALEIYNARGEVVRTLFHGQMPPGWYDFEWDGRSNDGERVAGGVYIACFDNAEVAVTRRVVLK